MTYQIDAFREYFIQRVGAKESTYYTYNSYLQRIDRLLGGLDEALRKDGSEKVLEWARSTNDPPFDLYPSHAKSVLKRYVQFLIDAETPTPSELIEEDGDDDELEPSGLAFKLEKEMQAAVRKQLTNLEADLVESDNGSERRVATGKIDIVARDKGGNLVAIELKAGLCPAGALEQALGYAEALSEEENGAKVRAILIA